MKHIAPLIAIAALLLSGCTPSSDEPPAPVDWYIALDGDDGNGCHTSSDPCATLDGALEKAEAENSANSSTPTHIFHIAAGTYSWSGSAAGYPMATVQLDAVIQGEGQGSTILDGSGVYGGIHFTDGGQATIRDLTLQNARGDAPVGCIAVDDAGAVTVEDVTTTNCGDAGIMHYGSGLLSLQRVTSTENTTGATGMGAGLYGPAIVIDSTFTHNELQGLSINGDVTISDSLASENGQAGVVVPGGHATLNNVAMNNNGPGGTSGTGLQVLGGAEVTAISGAMNGNYWGAWLRDAGTNVDFHDVQIVNNRAAGAFVETGAALSIFDSLVSGNASEGGRPGAGVHVEGAAEIHNSTISDNLRGAVWTVLAGETLISESLINANSGDSAIYIGEDASATIQRSLISDNATGDGPAVDDHGMLTLVNSTISGNGANGLNIVGAAALTHGTIAENGGIGIRVFVSEGVVLSLMNTLVASNAGGDCFTVAEAAPTLEGANIDTDASCGFPESYSSAALLLDSLADNGGPTWTHALLLGSPAIDAGGSSCPTEDQRNMARPLGDGCDVGAYEASGLAMSTGEEESEAPTATPTLSDLGRFTVVPDQNYNCRYGNSTAFDIADTLFEGETYAPIGIGSDRMWLQFRGPAFGELCWAPTGGFSLFLDNEPIELSDLPQDLMQTVAYPPTSTPTPDPDERYDITPTPSPSPTATCTPNQIKNQQCP